MLFARGFLPALFVSSVAAVALHPDRRDYEILTTSEDTTSSFLTYAAYNSTPPYTYPNTQPTYSSPPPYETPITSTTTCSTSSGYVVYVTVTATTPDVTTTVVVEITTSYYTPPATVNTTTTATSATTSVLLPAPTYIPSSALDLHPSFGLMAFALALFVL
ncbi:hypothetical protein H072_7941 [Dactylellina haptotyla CBS 200.50]|uniref:REJ domain-containing protein n=1 Tax=Dactylellina haptotyla (strain CBS 200.50) TaxID=1284197 RepID=S8BT35_DACHA|nr:hypothetical protein H072_7941 [Dactylellina haptotyla CBS 200.50]